MAVNFAKLPELPGQKVEREGDPPILGGFFRSSFQYAALRYDT